jgi:hypothetical protein
MDQIIISGQFAIGLLLGVAIPALLWAMRLFYLVKQTRDMHLEPDKYGFGSAGLSLQVATAMATQKEQHREYIDGMKALRYAFKELSHFMRWMVQQQTGKEPPPYIRKNGD